MDNPSDKAAVSSQPSDSTTVTDAWTSASKPYRLIRYTTNATHSYLTRATAHPIPSASSSLAPKSVPSHPNTFPEYIRVLRCNLAQSLHSFWNDIKPFHWRLDIRRPDIPNAIDPRIWLSHVMRGVKQLWQYWGKNSSIQRFKDGLPRLSFRSGKLQGSPQAGKKPLRSSKNKSTRNNGRSQTKPKKDTGSFCSIRGIYDSLFNGVGFLVRGITQNPAPLLALLVTTLLTILWYLYKDMERLGDNRRVLEVGVGALEMQ